MKYYSKIILLNRFFFDSIENFDIEIFFYILGAFHPLWLKGPWPGPVFRIRWLQLLPGITITIQFNKYRKRLLYIHRKKKKI